MAEISQRILDMVRRELVQNPAVENALLYEKAHTLDPVAMKDVDRRQFNARYPLRVKRFELKARKPKPKPKPDGAAKRTRRRPRSTKPVARASGTVLNKLAREGVRDVLLRFAQELANADTRGEIVGVVASVDQYVDQIIGLGSFPD